MSKFLTYEDRMLIERYLKENYTFTEICMHRSTAPYACNGCRELKKCTLTKTMYEAMEAQRNAAEKLSQSRSGIFSTEGEVARLNALLVPLVKQGKDTIQLRRRRAF